MTKFKIGDKVRIVSKRAFSMDEFGKMEKWLGKVMTIRSIDRYFPVYRMEEDCGENAGRGWLWDDSMIAGLAKPEQKPYTLELRFDGNTTRATLIKDGREVKTAEARCNPSDTFDRGEGAKVAVNRLFAKKEKPKKKEEPKKEEPWEKTRLFIVTGDSHLPIHVFPIGETVLRIMDSGIPGVSKYVSLKTGLMQSVSDRDVTAVKGTIR